MEAPSKAYKNLVEFLETRKPNPDLNLTKKLNDLVKEWEKEKGQDFKTQKEMQRAIGFARKISLQEQQTDFGKKFSKVVEVAKLVSGIALIIFGIAAVLAFGPATLLLGGLLVIGGSSMIYKAIENLKDPYKMLEGSLEKLPKIQK